MRHSLLSMVKLVLVVATLLLIVGGGVASAAVSIWQVEGDGGQVYLVGSIHLLSKNSYPLPDIYQEVYRQSGQVAFETDIAAIGSEKYQRMLFEKGVAAEGNQLKAGLDAGTYLELKNYLAGKKVNVESMSRLKPWFCVLTLLLTELQQLGYNPDNGLDQYYYRKAVADKKKVITLEDPDRHIGLLTGLDRFDQNSIVTQALVDLNNLKNNFETIVDAWKAGDAAKLDMLLNTGLNATPGVKEYLLDQRNRDWMEGIEAMLNKPTPTLVVVGTAHLVGSGSVVRLLRDKGYVVTQLQ